MGWKDHQRARWLRMVGQSGVEAMEDLVSSEAAFTNGMTDEKTRLIDDLSRRENHSLGMDGRAVATTRFVLEQVTSVDDSMYDMRSHLRKDAEVLDGVTRLRRRAELFRAFLQRLRFSQAQPTPASQTPEESS